MHVELFEPLIVFLLVLLPGEAHLARLVNILLLMLGLHLSQFAYGGAPDSRKLENIHFLLVDDPAFGVKDLRLLKETCLHVEGRRHQDLHAEALEDLYLLLLFVLGCDSLPLVDVAEVVVIWSSIVLIIQHQLLSTATTQSMRFELANEGSCSGSHGKDLI